MPPLPIAGEPAALAGGARHLAAGADSLRGVGGQLAGSVSFVVVAGAWRGPASEAFLAADQATRLGLQRAAGALGAAAAALAELAARLGHAQATWDEARRLAESAGLELGHDGAVAPGGALSASPAAAGLAARLAADAAHEAAAARAAAAARLDQVAAPPGPGRAPHGGGSPGGGGAPHGGGHGRRRGPLMDALEAGREAVTGTYHLLGGADARLRSAGRLATSSDDPSVRMAAARVVATAGRPLLDSRLAYTLPLAGAFLDTVVGVADGDPLPRAIARAVGGTVGAELGSRAGMAACGGPAAATQGVGLVACPVITVVAGAAGAEVGRRAAVRLYDEVVGPPAPAPGPPAERVRPGSR
jgi:uncharacterized protein YukE